MTPAFSAVSAEACLGHVQTHAVVDPGTMLLGATPGWEKSIDGCALSAPPGLEKPIDGQESVACASTCITASTSGHASFLGDPQERYCLFLDFHDCKNTVFAGLALAKQSIGLVDEDMAVALGQAESEASVLMAQAESVGWQLTNEDEYLRLAAMPSSLFARGQAKSNHHLIEKEAWVTTAKKALLDVRTAYVRLLEKTQYLEKCLDVCFLEEHLTSSDCELLKVGSVHLSTVIYRTECLSDFWLTLHSVELDLAKFEEGIQCLALGGAFL